VDGAYPFFNQIVGNYTGRNSTWAVFWYATIFDKHGLCLTPSKSLVNNIGLDGSGMHEMDSAIYESELKVGRKMSFPKAVVENDVAIRQLMAFYKCSQSRLVRLKNWCLLIMPPSLMSLIKIVKGIK